MKTEREPLVSESDESATVVVFVEAAVEVSEKPVEGNISLFALELYSLPDDIFSDLTKFKAFAVQNSNVARIMDSDFERVENILGKRRNY